MEGQLVQKKFVLDDVSFDCWVIKIGHKFWFKANDIAVFLDYKDPDDAVEERARWDNLDPRGRPGVPIPSYWKPHT
jgi:hypothetical protein